MAFLSRLSLALAADMVFLAAFGGGTEAICFSVFVGLWAGLADGNKRSRESGA